MNVQDILKKENVKIIDVREPYEFIADHLDGARNMPLSNFEHFLPEIKKLNGPKVFYCRSGNRSGQVVSYLQSIGMKDVYNGGALMFMKNFMIEG